MDAPLTIRLFGPIRVLVEGEPMPHVRSRKALWLLALLVLRDGRPAAREWVASALWPDADGGVGLANLRPVVSELRRALGSQGERLQAPDRNSLVFDLGGAEVDVVRFDRAFKSGDFQRAVEFYDGALLEGCLEEWSHQERNVREAECLTALETLAKQALEDGDLVLASSLYGRAVAVDPWRDAPRRGLMQALAKSGDVNAALQAYRDFAHLLSAEAGTAPDRETTALYDGFRADLRRPPRRTGGERLTPNNLSKPLGELIGREDERLDVAALLRRSRFVTLSGMGGIGKTRLAMAVASSALKEHPGGVWFVQLDTLTEGRAVPQAVAEALGVREEIGHQLSRKIADRICQGPSLLVLDNCEHLLNDAAWFATGLLRECPDLRVLATSREPMGIPGEIVWPVPALAFPEASSLPAGRATRLRVAQSYDSVQLFIQRAQAVRPDFELDAESLPAVIDICAQVEGIPLAIELAAARVRSMSVNDVAERLRDHHLEMLEGSGRAAERQQTLRATLDWSYNLLSDDERATLCQLSVFSGGWTLAAAEEVLEGGKKYGSRRLESLVDKSLVVFDRASGRYRYLETVRSYAGQRLDGADGRASAVLRHREWCRRLVEEARPALDGTNQAKWFPRIDLELDNLRAALDALEDSPADGLKFAIDVGFYWQARGLHREGLRYLDRFLAHGEAEPSVDRARALRRASDYRGTLGEYDACDSLDLEAVGIYRRLGLTRDAVVALYAIGVRALIAGNHQRAADRLEECLVECRGTDERFLFGHIRNSIAWNRQLMGDYSEARDGHEESLRVFREAGDGRGINWSLRALGNLSHAQCDYETAQALHEESIAGFEDQKDLDGMAWSLDSLGRIASDLGQPGVAEKILDGCLRSFRERQDAKGTASALAALGNAALSRQDFPTATQLSEESLGICRKMGTKPGIVEALLLLGEVSLAQNKVVVGKAFLSEALGLCQEMGSRKMTAEAVQVCAAFRERAGQAAEAVNLWGAADALRTGMGTHLPPVKLPAHTTGLCRARTELGDLSFESAWGEGQGWEANVALEKALGYLSSA